MGSPGIKTHNTNQHSSRARLQHSNHPPSLPTPNQQGLHQILSAVKHRWAEPHYNKDTIRLSRDTQRFPPGGPITKSGR